MEKKTSNPDMIQKGIHTSGGKRFTFAGIIRFLIIFFLLVNSPQAHAKTLFGIVSDRSSTALAAGADYFLDRNSGHKLEFRSTSQLARMTDAEILSLWRSSDVVLTIGVFGDTAVRLQSLMDKNKDSRPFLSISSTLALIKRTQDRHGLLFNGFDNKKMKRIGKSTRGKESLTDWTAKLSNEFPRQKIWIHAKGYWLARGQENISNLISLSLNSGGAEIKPGPINPQKKVRFYQNRSFMDEQDIALTRPWVAIIDHDTGDRKGNIDLVDQLCSTAKIEGLDCLGIFAAWGKSSTLALKSIKKYAQQVPLAGVISLQDFVIGGGEGRSETIQVLQNLNVPILKGIRLVERTRQHWTLSEDGLPWNSVHYRVAMPEIQGVSQSLVLAAATKAWLHKKTGLLLSITEPLPKQAERMIRRITGWYNLREKNNSDKKVAIIYYNHPPGRHNVGADNLDVPESLWNILNLMNARGYKTGKLPKDSAALLDLIQEKGVNLPENADELKNMVETGITVSPDVYQQWLGDLPSSLQAELEEGPLGFLHENIKIALKSSEPALIKRLLDRVVGDVKFVLEGTDHPARERAHSLLHQLESEYNKLLNNSGDWNKAEGLSKAIRATNIEGIRGWGKAPGKVMVQNEQILIPGIQFGNVFLGPQPPRGWELNEELLHANTTFPPTHQYLAFYFWLRHVFKADAIVHVGRHSTYEFLPRHSTGVGSLDYSWHIAGEIPGIYPYIVDGVGEGIQAKRRGLAVMVDHLTPPLSTTELYDDLLGLRQLIESYEAADPDPTSPARIRAVSAIRERIETLNLKDELASSMAAELKVRGIKFEEVDDDLLVHETGHYLTQLQENYMPLGLHVFGLDWKDSAIETMLNSMLSEKKNNKKIKMISANLKKSPEHERLSFFNALKGGYVEPGKGNDPIRTSESLPTGRNFHALDGSLLPTRLGYSLGKELSAKARKDTSPKKDEKEAVILWASDAVRDEGAMIAFGFDLLGLEPVWNGRGILTGVRRIPLKNSRKRRDVVFVTSGLFRDLYGAQLDWLDKSVLLALDGASETILKKFPELASPLAEALKPLEKLATGGSESLEENQVAKQWVKETQKLLSEGVKNSQAGRQASLRIFGTAPGSYGAGVNKLAERSGSWNDRMEIAKAYVNRMGHAYGIGFRGERMNEQFASNLANVKNTYLGRASNLYGLMDNNDAFDYMGGLSLAIESLTGTPPAARVIHHADPQNATLTPLDQALMAELRGQFLNPAWLKPLMDHNYSGARTMGSEFLEYLWGWQVTSPDIIKSWMWDEVKSVYVDDKHQLGLDEFLEQGHNAHVKTNMLAIMLVAAQKGFWQTDEETLKKLSNDFANLIIKNGLPGSGHTHPDHPIYEWIGKHLTEEQLMSLKRILDNARIQEKPQEPQITSIAEVKLDQSENNQEQTNVSELTGIKTVLGKHQFVLWGTVIGMVLAGFYRGRQKPWEKN
ncbi:MAG: cobaltochelatase subunit CobN [Nitrospinota bacterium]